MKYPKKYHLSEKKMIDLILDRQNGIHKQPQYINGIMKLLVVEH